MKSVVLIVGTGHNRSTIVGGLIAQNLQAATHYGELSQMFTGGKAGRLIQKSKLWENFFDQNNDFPITAGATDTGTKLSYLRMTLIDRLLQHQDAIVDSSKDLSYVLSFVFNSKGRYRIYVVHPPTTKRRSKIKDFLIALVFFSVSFFIANFRYFRIGKFTKDELRNCLSNFLRELPKADSENLDLIDFSERGWLVGGNRLRKAGRTIEVAYESSPT